MLLVLLYNPAGLRTARVLAAIDHVCDQQPGLAAASKYLSFISLAFTTSLAEFDQKDYACEKEYLYERERTSARDI